MGNSKTERSSAAERHKRGTRVGSFDGARERRAQIGGVISVFLKVARAPIVGNARRARTVVILRPSFYRARPANILRLALPLGPYSEGVINHFLYLYKLLRGTLGVIILTSLLAKLLQRCLKVGVRKW